MPSIAILGSLNIDFVTVTPRLPQGGETMSATSINTSYGGKGANQAVAAARLSSPGTRVYMSGAVGSDAFGPAYISALKDEGIDTSLVRTAQGPTGLANVIVESSGENRILLSAGANGALTAEDALLPESDVDVLVLQLEVPMEVVVANAARAKRRGAYVLLNPAPAVELPAELWKELDCVVVNETEAEILAPEGDWATAFFQRGVADLVVRTLGGDGVEWVKRDGSRGKVSAEKVEVVDTTAAGDTFVGALAGRIADARTGDVEAAIRWANKAAAITVQRRGAMDAIPKRHEVQA